MYERLRAEMVKQGISGNRLALISLISPSDFSRAINGKMPFYPAWRERISDALGVDETKIFDMENGKENE